MHPIPEADELVGMDHPLAMARMQAFMDASLQALFGEPAEPKVFVESTVRRLQELFGPLPDAPLRRYAEAAARSVEYPEEEAPPLLLPHERAEALGTGRETRCIQARRLRCLPRSTCRSIA